MKVRHATTDDASQLAKIHVDSWRVAYQGLVPDTHLDSLDYDRRTDNFRQRLRTGDVETDLVELEGRILGFVTFEPYRGADTDKTTSGEIWGIYVAPDDWRKGCGTVLYKHAENALKERGYAKFFIWVFTQNPRARRFYEAMGFKTDGGSKMLNFGISLEVIRYRKELKNAEPVASAYGILSMPPLSRNVLLITELTSHHRH